MTSDIVVVVTSTDINYTTLYMVLTSAHTTRCVTSPLIRKCSEPLLNSTGPELTNFSMENYHITS
jgi:hypothetical protein